LENVKAIFTIFAHRVAHAKIQRVQQKCIAREANKLCVVVVLYANQDERICSVVRGKNAIHETLQTATNVKTEYLLLSE